MMTNLRIIQLSDIHGVTRHLNTIAEELEAADLIILTGDITHFGYTADARKVITCLDSYNKHILAVSGNCDNPDISTYLADNHLSLHRQLVKFAGFHLTGLGGSLPCPGHTPNEYTDDQATKMLHEMQQNLPDTRPLLLVSHQPPFNTRNDMLNNGLHVGSQALRNFINEVQPLLCLTGHIHEGRGTDRIGSCTIINPGPFRNGHFACITINGEKSVNVELKQVTA